MKKHTLLYSALLLGFLLGIQDGYIALWRDGAAQPEIFPYRAEMLPEADREKLKNGIRIEDNTKLAHILEDYLS